jgi:hypothetical protein
VTTVLTKDGMTHGLAIDFPSIIMAADTKAWIASEEGHSVTKQAFESTSRLSEHLVRAKGLGLLFQIFIQFPLHHLSSSTTSDFESVVD